MEADFLKRYAVENVGATVHEELWVPTDEREELNEHIVGVIEVTQTFR